MCGKVNKVMVPIFLKKIKFSAADGYLAVGYDTIHIDDCWEEWNRSVDGKLVANRTRFPSGINGLSKYVIYLFLFKLN